MGEKDHQKPTGLMKPFFRVFRRILIMFTCPFFRVSFEGKENIPESGPFILASNHKSLMDPIWITRGVKHLQLWAMAKEELFKIPIVGSVLKGAGAYPVSRGSGDTSAMDAAKDIIQQGCVLLIFPEGHRSKTEELLPAKSGIGLICAETNADVLPVSIYFKGKLHIWSKIIVRYGKIIPSESFSFSVPLKSKERKEASRKIMEDISKLYHKGYE